MSMTATFRAWRHLFLGDDDKPTDAGDLVLRDLEKLCGWMVKDLPRDNQGAVDPYQSVADLHKRAIYSTIKARLFGEMPKEKDE